MAKMRPPDDPREAVPVLPDDDVRRLIDSCAGKDFRNRRDLVIIRLFRDIGMRHEGMGGLRYSAEDPKMSDVDAGGAHHREGPPGAGVADRHQVRPGH